MVRTLVPLVLLFVALSAGDVERRLSFDSEGRLFELSPALNREIDVFPDIIQAERIELWQYQSGIFIEVYTADGTRRRLEITEAELAEVRRKVDSHLAARTETPRLDQSGRGRLLIEQIPLALGWYGTAVAGLVSSSGSGDARLGVASYLLSASASYFVPFLLTSNARMTEAQAHLCVAYGYRGIITGGMISLSADTPDGRQALATMMLTSVGGQLVGYALADRLHSGPAHLVTAYTDLGTLDGALAGGLVASLLPGDVLPQHPFTIGTVAGQVAGGWFGYTRARHSDCTEGQVYAIYAGGFLATALPPAMYYAATGAGDPKHHLTIMAGLGLAGSGLGMWWMEQNLGQDRFSTGNGLIVAGTTIGGALLGAGVGALFGSSGEFGDYEPEPRAIAGLGAAGGAAGFWGGLTLARGLQEGQEIRTRAPQLGINLAALASATTQYAAAGEFSAPNLVILRF